MRKVCVFSSTRAEYGLLRLLLREIQDDPKLSLQMLVSGTHLSAEHGMTVNEILADGFAVNEQVPILDEDDSPAAICRAMGRGIEGYQQALERLSPDIVVILGDRYEAFACAASATACRIPIAHLHGGEATHGLFDEPFRHAITKMSHLHFTSTEAYRQRVIQLGESPKRVWNVGALGCEAIQRITLMERNALSRDLGFDLSSPYILVTFHPVTLENATAERQFRKLLDAIVATEGLKAIFTYANSDTEGSQINQMIDEAVAQWPDRFMGRQSLGQLRYLSAMSYCSAVVGNSSSGLLEAPSLHVPTLDIGDRQKGRIRSASVVHVEPGDVACGLKNVLSPQAREQASSVVNPYEGKAPSLLIRERLSEADLKNILKKEFYDLPD